MVESTGFPDTIIPVEIKKFTSFDIDKFENLMFQCHSYRFSTFKDKQPTICLYFIDGYFEPGSHEKPPPYDYLAAKDPESPDFEIKQKILEKKAVENLFGRFGIGELVINNNGYNFRMKRQGLFEKTSHRGLVYKSSILNFWWGSKANSKRIDTK
jgi:hypothetical protein